jgi:hypothetical protein
LLAVSCKKHSVSYKTLTLQPTNNPTEYDIIQLGDSSQADQSGPTTASIQGFAWTKNLETYLDRGLLEFDLSTIPSSAIIDSAFLYLYSNPSPITGDLINANSGTDNSFVFQQVTYQWSTSTVSWANQPSTSSSNQIVIATTTQPQLDLNIDVASMISSMVKNNVNYGFLLKLQNEVIYTSRIFVGSRNTDYPDKHPKLEVWYLTN